MYVAHSLFTHALTHMLSYTLPPALPQSLTHSYPPFPSLYVPQGILIPRSREQLEKDMQDCFLMTRDGSTLACGMLKRYRCV